jgi:hypothetical protein
LPNYLPKLYKDLMNDSFGDSGELVENAEEVRKRKLTWIDAHSLDDEKIEVR